MGELAHPIWEFIWKLTTVAGIGGGGALPSSVGRSDSTMVKCGPKLLVPILGPGGGSFVRTHVSVRTVCLCVRDA